MVGTIWVGALVINCVQGRDKTVSRGHKSFTVPRVGTIQWVGALVIHCVQDRDNTVGRTIQWAGGCTVLPWLCKLSVSLSWKL